MTLPISPSSQFDVQKLNSIGIQPSISEAVNKTKSAASGSTINAAQDMAVKANQLATSAASPTNGVPVIEMPSVKPGLKMNNDILITLTALEDKSYGIPQNSNLAIEAAVEMKKCMNDRRDANAKMEAKFIEFGYAAGKYEQRATHDQANAIRSTGISTFATEVLLAGAGAAKQLSSATRTFQGSKLKNNAQQIFDGQKTKLEGQVNVLSKRNEAIKAGTLAKPSENTELQANQKRLNAAQSALDKYVKAGPAAIVTQGDEILRDAEIDRVSGRLLQDNASQAVTKIVDGMGRGAETEKQEAALKERTIKDLLISMTQTQSRLVDDDTAAITDIRQQINKLVEIELNVQNHAAQM